MILNKHIYQTGLTTPNWQVYENSILNQSIGGSEGGVPGARPPPPTKDPDSFVSTYKHF